MQSSQEKVLNYISTIEKNIEKTIRRQRNEIIVNEYRDYLLEEESFTKNDEHCIKKNQNKQENANDQSLLESFSDLKEKIAENEIELQNLNEEIDTLTFQSIAENEKYRVEKNEKEQHIKTYYVIETDKLKQILKADDMEYRKAEQEIENQIMLEKATKNARLSEIRNSLQRQIAEKNSEYVRTQTEYRALKKEAEDIKVEQSRRSNKNHTPNIMQFESRTIIGENENLFSNSYLPKPSSSNTKSIISSNSLYNNKANQDENNLHVGDGNALQNKYFNLASNNNKTASKLEQNKDKNIYNLSEYEEFERCYTTSMIDKGVAGGNTSLRPNPCRIASIKKEHDASGVENSISYETKCGTSSKDNPRTKEVESLELEDDSFIFEDVLKRSDSVESHNVPRKVVPVFMGNNKRRSRKV